MELRLFEADNGSCPYLDKRDWLSHMFQVDKLDGAVYEMLINHGFRRNGLIFYRNNCPDCNDCRPLRVIAKQYKPSRSQRRVWSKNQDLRIEIHEVGFDQESFNLYQDYSQSRFGTSTTIEDYYNFLIRSAVDTVMMKYYLGLTLIAIGWVDILTNSLSSVYFAYNLDYAKRSLGVFSIMKEIEMCVEKDMDSLQMGFWIQGCKSMVYKTKYYPHELLIENNWVAPNRLEKINN